MNNGIYLPKGTSIHTEHVYDNSKQNAQNPDPTVAVPLILILSFLTACSVAQARPMSDLTVTDIDGKSHKLYDHDSKATVLIAYGSSCPMLRRMAPSIESLAAEYQAKGIRFFYIAGTPQDTGESLRRERDKFGFKQPVIYDPEQKLLAETGLQTTTEVAVVESTSTRALGCKITFKKR
ncbi:MAG: TlpA family protein disulfide reductase [Bdellovibrionaceae bacterium]|nr:TlpA family protein disulfide reductase [Pseudobdellovibrionaceae bacterium]